MNPNAYERLIFGNHGRSFFQDFIENESWHYEYKTQHDSGMRMGTAEELEPRAGYIDGGIILAETFTLSKKDYVEMEASEWNQLSDWMDEMSNIWGNVILKDETGEAIVWQVFDKVPVITSMEA